MSASAQAALNRVLNSPAYANKRKDPYFETIEILPLAASASGATGSVQVADDGDFLIVYITAKVTAVDNTTFLTDTNWPFLVTLKDGGSGRDLMDKPVHLGNFAGTVLQPNVLPFPRHVDRATALTITAQNLSATAYNVRVTLHGVKLYG